MSTITSLNNHLTTLETQLASPSRAGKPKPSTPIPNTKQHIERRPYHRWQGNNTICCNGRIIGGPQKQNFAITLILIIVPSIFFIGFVSVNYISEYNYYYVLIIYILLLIISVISFALTAFIDPGIIPRGILPLESGYKGPTQLRQTMCISGKLVEIKWCGTCHIFRPPRSFHCYICNNCVERFDHHCPWIGNCIGIRNYAYFSIFVNSLQLLCFWALFHCVYILYLRTNHHKIQNKSSWKQFTYALKYEYMAFGTGIYVFIGMWFVIGLTWFHWFLVFVGKTTNEQLRNLHPSGSPFKRSCFGNIMDHCCQFPATSVHLHHVTPKTSYNETYVNKQKVIFLDNEQVKKHHKHIHSMHIDNNSPFKACIINKTKTKTNAIVNGVDNNTLMTGNNNKYKNGYGFVIHPMQPTHIEMTHFNKKASTNGYQTLDATQNNMENDGKIEEEEEIIIHSNNENDKEEKKQTIIISDIAKNAEQKQAKDTEVKVDENAFEQFEENKYQHMDINYGDNNSSDSLAKSKSRKDENIDQENSYISYDDDDDEDDGNGSNPLQLQGQQFQYSMSATPDISAANGDRNSSTPAPVPQTAYVPQEINNEYKNENLEVTNVKNRNNPRLLSNVSVPSQSPGSDNW